MIDLDKARRQARAALDLRAAFEAHKDAVYGDMCKQALSTWPHVLAELVNGMADEAALAREIIAAIESLRLERSPPDGPAGHKELYSLRNEDVRRLLAALAAYARGTRADTASGGAKVGGDK